MQTNMITLQSKLTPRKTMVESSNSERVLGSFASLLSSNLTMGSDLTASRQLGGTASTLPCFISPHVNSDEICVALPSLRLKHADKQVPKAPCSLEEKAALNLARPLTLCRGGLEAAPMVLLANICESFMALIDSRFRSSFSALVRQAKKQKDLTLTRILVGLLKAVKRPISSTTIVTSFRVLPVSERSPLGDHILPIVMEAVVDLSVLGELVPVTIVAPGTIQGAGGRGGDMLSKVEVVLDTVAFLHSMMRQARHAVRKCIAISTNTATTLLSVMSQMRKSPSFSRDLKADLRKGGSTDESKEADPSEQSPFMMPPPPRRPSRRSLCDLRRVTFNQLCATHSVACPNSEKKNASWNTDPPKKDDGLNLLTAAAGLKRSKAGEEPSNKRQKRAVGIHSELFASQTQQRKSTLKSTSCPDMFGTAL